MIAAGLYELTSMKRYFRWRCRQNPRSGLEFGLHCVGASIGLMLVLVAISVMNVGWMCIVAVTVLAQKLLPENRAVDLPLAAAIVALGALIIVTPTSVPGLMM